MGFFEDISSIKGRKGLFTIILTAAILTIFEMFMFYKIFVPDIAEEIDSNIKRVGKQIAIKINEEDKKLHKYSLEKQLEINEPISSIFNDMNEDILATLTAREKTLADSINNYTIFTGILIVLILFLLLYLLWASIKNDIMIHDILTHDHADMTDATLTAVLTIVIVIAFQILFYYYGEHYEYQGAEGHEELLWLILDSVQSKRANKLNQINQINQNSQINQINQINQHNQINQNSQINQLESSSYII